MTDTAASSGLTRVPTAGCRSPASALHRRASLTELVDRALLPLTHHVVHHLTPTHSDSSNNRLCHQTSPSRHCGLWPTPGRGMRHELAARSARRLPVSAPGRWVTSSNGPTSCLAQFVAYLDEEGDATVTAEHALASAIAPGRRGHKLVGAWASSLLSQHPEFHLPSRQHPPWSSRLSFNTLPRKRFRDHKTSRSRHPLYRVRLWTVGYTEPSHLARG